MEQCIQAEARLAELLGYSDIRQVGTGLFGWHAENAKSLNLPQGESFPIPPWTRNWAACAPLIVQHRVDIITGAECASAAVGNGAHHKVVLANYHDHGSEDAALRYAIVFAVIHKLQQLEQAP